MSSLIICFESETDLVTKWYNDSDLWAEFMHDIAYYVIYDLEG